MEISLKESIDKYMMLHITVKLAEYDLLFDIDSGSTDNIIFDYVFKQLRSSFSIVNDSSRSMGIDGNYVENPIAEAAIGIGGKSISTQFVIFNADQTVINLQNDYGFQLHGILGVPFLIDNNCVIDLNRKTLLINK